LNSLLSFLIVASVIYFLVVLPMNRLMERVNAIGLKEEKPVADSQPDAETNKN
jgi:large-conductance mechanosensitive channel